MNVNSVQTDNEARAAVARAAYLPSQFAKLKGDFDPQLPRRRPLCRRAAPCTADEGRTPPARTLNEFRSHLPAPGRHNHFLLHGHCGDCCQVAPTADEIIVGRSEDG
jgi:hypothetical protein